MAKSIEEKRARWRQNAKSYYNTHPDKVKEYHALHRSAAPLSYTPKSLITGLTASNVAKALGIPRQQVVDELKGALQSVGRRYPLEEVKEYAVSHELAVDNIDDLIAERQEFIQTEADKMTPERRAELTARMAKAREVLKSRSSSLGEV